MSTSSESSELPEPPDSSAPAASSTPAPSTPAASSASAASTASPIAATPSTLSTPSFSSAGEPRGSARWRARLAALGLDPARDAVNYRVLKHTTSLAEYKAWFALPPRADTAANDAAPEHIAALPDGLLRRFVQEHIANVRVLTNPATLAAVEQRVGRFHLSVQAAADITITGSAPLYLNSPNTIVAYDAVTIEQGGFIQITAACSFECQTLTRVDDGHAAAYDVQAIGVDGTPDTAGVVSPAPPQAADGRSGACDCCGGTIAKAPASGAPGLTGVPGGSAAGRNSAGQPGAEVYFTIEQALSGTLTFLNRGGQGGNGASGGAGATGGLGGNGGNGVRCGAYEVGGANGGAGGQGGSGGNGSSGAAGGSGGTLTITVPAAAVANVSVTNAQAAGGSAGPGGAPGSGGQGGLGGSMGGQTGMPGSAGSSAGASGVPGPSGAKGSSTLNGTPVGG